MEHRWGERVGVNWRAQVLLGGKRRIQGMLCDASISGCRVETAGRCRVRHDTEVEVLIWSDSTPHEMIQLQGCIVRRLDRELGIEWSDLSPPGIERLLNRSALQYVEPAVAALSWG